MSYDIVQYLYNHVRCCQLRVLNDFFQNASTFLCQIRALVTVAAHCARVFFTLLLVLHIQHVVLASGFTDLSAVFSFFHGIVYSHTCCKTPDYKYWMPTLVKEITVLQKME